MTKRIFLTSSVNRVASSIAQKIGKINKMKLLYIYTAAEKKLGEKWQEYDKRSLEKAGFEVISYTITGKTKETIKKDVAAVGAIYIGGGNTFYLLEKIQKARCAKVFQEAIKAGKIFIGTSAGSIVAGPDIYPAYRLDRVSEAPGLKGYKGLGLVDFVVLPHWGSEHFKNLYLKQRLSHNYNTKNKLVLLNDYQYIQVEGDWSKLVDIRREK
jgi:dipeptidase E